MKVDGSSVLYWEIFHRDATVVPLHWLERGGWQDNLVEIGSIIYFIELEEEIGRILCKFSIRHFSNIEHWEKGGPNKIVPFQIHTHTHTILNVKIGFWFYLHHPRVSAWCKLSADQICTDRAVANNSYIIATFCYKKLNWQLKWNLLLETPTTCDTYTQVVNTRTMVQCV